MTTHHFTIETADYTGYVDGKEKEIKKTGNTDEEIDKINIALDVFWEHREKLSGKFHELDLWDNQDDEPLLFYPFSIEDSKDLKENRYNEDRFILEMRRKDNAYTLKTGCLMGFISATFKKDDKDPDSDDYHFNIYIHSRFDGDWYQKGANEEPDSKNPKIRYDGTDEILTERENNNAGLSKDFFLHYMLQRVLNINVSRNPSVGEDDSNLELMMYFFPAMLRRAMKQGFYKHYVNHEYNDARVRGAIDVSRHIATNYPFCGKIAYSATEYDYDNPLTQLVRHTIEYIRRHEWASELLSQTEETRQDVRDIVENTERYHSNERQRIIKQNMRLINHPFYTEWRPLQNLCLAILRHDDLRYDRANDEDRIHGVLFDGPWLWENYLWEVFEEYKLGFKHPDNTTAKEGIDDGKTRRYPDFYLRNNRISIPNKNEFYAKEIWDGKFKPGYEKKDINSADRLQLIGYMYIMSKRCEVDKNPCECHLCDTAGIVSPVIVKESSLNGPIELTGLGGKLYKWQLKIASGCSNFNSFRKEMKGNEGKFIEAYRKEFHPEQLSLN